MGGRLVGAAAVAAVVLALPAPAVAREVEHPDGAVYRPGLTGTYFHPLASFGKLNEAITAGRKGRAQKLADSLIARAAPAGRFQLVWHYDVPGGRSGWTSGLAQAVAAQALARAGREEEARRAFLAIPNGLLTQLPQGPWIKLYGYDDVVVLNAQLQAAVSIGEYARIVDDPRAKRLAADLRKSAKALLPRFDTGQWSLYSLAGQPATVEYHEYVVSLLWKLSARQAGGVWRTYASRFRFYMRVPPELRKGPAPAPVAAVPDGYRDSTTIKFWLSKPAFVVFDAGGTTWSSSFGRGWKTTTYWPSPDLPRGTHPVWASATDFAGNVTRMRLQDVRAERDEKPPAVRAGLRGRRLEWRASDDGSPWFEVRVERVVGGRFHVTELGRFDREGAAELVTRPASGVPVALVVADSSGNVSRIPLCVAA